MKLLLFVATLSMSSIVPGRRDQANTTQAQVDLVELNHFLDDNGREVFRQVVFFDWSRRNRQFEVRAWRLVKHPSQLPRRVNGEPGYVVRWQDKSVMREVLAKSMRETWSQEDPERVNRQRLPENERVPLWPTN